ncbi:MAG: GNAT family N-acetyltransferase [Bacilli bacterium]
MIKQLKIYEDFVKIIKVFQQKPFYEKLTEEDIQKEFQLYIDGKGGAFAYYDIDEIVGITCFTEGFESEHGIIFPDFNKVSYISGMATLEKARGKGVGTDLMEYTLDNFKNEKNYDYTYLRTNLIGSMSSGIAKKHGFITLEKNNQIYTQQVTFERIDPNIPNTDIRKFMAKTLTKEANYDKISY